MREKLNIADLWNVLGEYVLIDVRTPAEYQKGHIPQAINMPLFSNEERVEVGTIYKQESPEKALKRGLDFVGGKMIWFVDEAEQVAPDKKVVIHCWRGGKRSQSIAWLLGMAGFDVLTLEGGYKAYRNFIREAFYKEKLKLIVLGGRTGTGKTQILKALKEQGEQIIPLEKMAHHKGSAFGSIGETVQPSSESFGNTLFECLREIDQTRPIWIENESRSIGRIHIPDGLWEQMKSAPLINIELPFDERLNILVDVYANYPDEDLLAAFYKLKKRLGGLALKKAVDAIELSDYKTAAAIALKYYDKAYQYNLEVNKSPRIDILNFEKHEPVETAKALIRFAGKYG